MSGIIVGFVKIDALIKKTHEGVCNIATAKGTILVPENGACSLVL